MPVGVSTDHVPYVEGNVCRTRRGSDCLAIAREQEELHGCDVVHQPISLELILRLEQRRYVGRIEERLGLFLEGGQKSLGDN